jgi:hypothetical protein
MSDWIGKYKGREREVCQICGGDIPPESYVGIKPDGEIYCKNCLMDKIIRRQQEESNLEKSTLNSRILYI